jgi:hypothetical protein
LSEQGIKVYTFDFDSSLNPDFIGDICNISTILNDKYFDVILCCQILEHIPYENFDNILKQLKVHAKNVVISLPYSGITFEAILKIPKIKIDIHFRFNRFWRVYKFNGEHYWEIGNIGYPIKKIKSSISRYFKIRKMFFAKYNNYHLFFICNGK